MSKSAEAFRTISEVAEALDTPAHVLRFWESRFSHVKPVKRAGGRRYYRPADVSLLAGIRKLLHDDGMTIRGVQKLLRERGVRHVASLAEDAAAVDDSPIMAPETPTAANSPPPAPPAAAAVAAAPAPTPAEPRKAPAPLADTAPGVSARADLQRERDAASLPQDPAQPTTHRDAPLADGATIPAAALLRAMTAYHASQRRSELRVIYRRISEIHERRSKSGHSSGR
jgi:resuscitation-promoting factor RpfA